MVRSRCRASLWQCSVKVPFVDTVEAIEVRRRKDTEALAAATGNQLPVTTEVSINWTVERYSAMDLFNPARWTRAVREPHSRPEAAKHGQGGDFVELVRAKRWDTVLPRTVLGEGIGALLSMPVER